MKTIRALEIRCFLRWRASAFQAYDETDFQLIRKSLKPTVIPSPGALRKAFTTPWSLATGVNFTLWCSMLVAGWCWVVWGCRANCDMESLKNGDTHCDNEVQGWGWTAYKGGRNKLPGKKAGSRPWRCWFVCTCKGGKHIPVPESWEFCIGSDGNPRQRIPFPTECPLNARQIIQRMSADPADWRLFSKWTKTTQRYVSNHGDPADLGRRFMEIQGAGAGGGLTYCHNAGRHATAGWLTDVNAPYHESVNIHGDLPCVWRRYQPSLLHSDYRNRDQQVVANIACAALYRLRQKWGRGNRPSDLTKGLKLGDQLMVAFMTSQGQNELARQVVNRHRQAGAQEEEEEEEDLFFDDA